MYDKVSLWIDRCDIGDSLSSVAQRLDDANEVLSLSRGTTKVYGDVGGLSVGIYESGLWISGSLSKYLNGSNIYTLTRSETEEAVSYLSEDLGVDIGKAKVLSLEFGTNFVMRHEVGEYFERLGGCPYLNREIICGSLYYNGKGREENRNKSYVFYDKIRELKQKRVDIPDNMEGVNMLRYEIRLKKGLDKFFNVERVTADMLSDKAFYASLVDKYKTIYTSIEKVTNSSKVDMGKIKTVSDAFGAYVGQLLVKSERGDLEAFLQELKANGKFTNRSEYIRLKKMFSDCAKYIEKGSDDLLKELDGEIKNVCGFM